MADVEGHLDGWGAADTTERAPALHAGEQASGSAGASAGTSDGGKFGDRAIELTFADLCYRVPAKTGDSVTAKDVLTGVSGHVSSGQLLALMGPSGSGKTSLLNVLSQRANRAASDKSMGWGGQILLNGQPPDKAMKQRCAFVFQDDMLLSNLTVRETLEFSAQLRLPQGMAAEEKDQRVQGVLESLRLLDCADSNIGGPGQRGVSGGERKRVSIGVELVTSPDVLFCDEPTSGLDASTALTIITLLKTLASQRGLVLICSIHQPRSNIFSLFTQLLVLSKGQTAYFGKTSEVVAHFEQLGHRLPLQTNPADWIMDLVTSDAAEHIVAAYTRHEPPRLQIVPAARPPAPTTAARYPTSFWWQFKVLLTRQAKQQRGEVFNKVNCFNIFAVALIASMVWWQSNSVADIIGCCFFCNIQQCFNTLLAVVRLFPQERNLMMRERSQGAYAVLPYFLAKSSSDFVATIVLPLSYAACVYWCAGLRNDAVAFFGFVALFMLAILAAQSLAIMISCAIPDFATANAVSTVIMLLNMLFGGFYVQNERIPIWCQWFAWS